MPFYEYECESCKFYLEIMQKISDPPLRKCPSCGKNTMKKLISAPVFRLKGAGWYETDFKSDKENKRNLAVEKEPETKEAKPAEAATAETSKSEAKAAEAKPAEAGPKPAAASERKSVVMPRRAPARSKRTAKARPRKKARR